MKKDETNCPSFEEWVEAHHDGGDVLAGLLAHGRSCPSCAELAAVAETLAAELRQPEEASPPAGMHGRIMGKLRRAAWSDPRAWAHRLRRLLLPVTVTATATAFVLLGFTPSVDPSAPSSPPTTERPAVASTSVRSELHLACLWGRVEAGDAGAWQTVARDGELDAGKAVRVARGGRAVLRHGASCTVLLEGPCLYRPSTHGGRLTRGLASFSVLPGSAPFAVATPEGRVSVLGTRFAVHVAETGRMTVRVDEGRVAVEAGGARREIGAGERWEGTTSIAPSGEPLAGSAVGGGSTEAARTGARTQAMARSVTARGGTTDSEQIGTESKDTARSAPSLDGTTEERGIRLPSGAVSGEDGDGGPHTVREGF